MQYSFYTLFRYIFSGGIAAGINIALFSLLLLTFHVWYLLASVISFSVSFVVSFYMQKHWTFRDSSTAQMKQQLFYYFLITTVNLGINVLLMMFFVQALGINPVIAKAVTLIILACWSFVVYQKYIFTKKKKF